MYYLYKLSTVFMSLFSAFFTACCLQVPKESTFLKQWPVGSNTDQTATHHVLMQHAYLVSNARPYMSIYNTSYHPKVREESSAF